MSLAMQSIYVSTSGAINQERRLQVVSNNLANVNTVGFKKDRPAFKDYLSPRGGEVAGRRLLYPLMPVVYTPGVFKDDKVYVVMDQVKTDWTQGSEKLTSNPLDLSIIGQGFFKLHTPHGPRYTRAGNFTISSAGLLVNQDGLEVMGKQGSILLQGREVTFGQDGSIFVAGRYVDSLQIVNFPHLELLQKEGEQLYVNNQDINPERQAPQCEIRQGYLELSNVNVVKEMTRMIELMRAFETHQRFIQNIDTINGRLVTEVPRIA